MGAQWYNYKAEEFVSLEGFPDKPEEYISQQPAAQNLYALLVGEMGKSPQEALIQVLSAQCQAHDKEAPDA